MQGTISTSQHIGLPGGSPICCERKFPALSMSRFRNGEEKQDAKTENEARLTIDGAAHNELIH